ncbi:MAG: hypothetical protein JSV88_05005 [Candidatus Aminicenantes bacterium]|nr:MAG: hypothetical protein JSV88_05005 [Candidatus Aminicenantes bacterium]
MSVNFNLVSASLSDEDHASIINSIKSIESLIPFAVTLPADEKVSMPGIGVKTIEFIDKSFEYASKNPNLVPQFLDMGEFEKDTKLAKKLQLVMDHLIPLAAKLSDTFALVGAEAYSSSRIFYHHTKNAARANVPGASAVAKELSKRFKVVKSRFPSDDETSDTSESQ